VNKETSNLKIKIKDILENYHLEFLFIVYKKLKIIFNNCKINFSIIFSLPVFYLFIEKKKKYLICRPRGGLNDILNQMELCCRYSLKYHRKLFIDTNRSGFLDSFENYFILPSYIFTGVIDSVNYPVSVYPLYLQNDIYNYETECFNDIFKIKNGPYLNLDFEKDYSEQYLIHENWGGGENSIYFLKRIKLKKSIRLHISKIINSLGIYIAVHIRNTDIQTDYKQFLDTVKEESIYKNIVICTDDYAVQQYGKIIFGDKLILPTNIPDLKGESLHNNHNLDRYKTNIDTITDLFVLACSEKLYITKTKEDIYSGFLFFSRNLHQDSRLINKLLY
jgi:hypothetical protein